MSLDFCFGGKLNKELVSLFNETALDIRQEFVDLIADLSRGNEGNIDWWVSSPASRNTLTSPFFHYCCCIALLQKLIRANESFTEIITDSRAFKKILEDYLAKQGINPRVILTRLPVKQRLKELVRLIFTIYGIPLRQMLLFFSVKLTRSLRKPFPPEPLTLINTFVMAGYIEKDRYYPGVLDALSENEKQRIWFAPQLYGFHSWQYLSVVRTLRRSKRNFILKNDYLRIRDYFYAFGHILRIYGLRIKPCDFCGMDISPLVREEMRDFRRNVPSCGALLNYKFAKRLKQGDIQIKLVIDWFENNDISKSWNVGFRRFFPTTTTKGYQGFIASPFYSFLYPTEEEKKNEVIPHEILVVGKRLEQTALRFCPSLNVKVAPAFRFTRVWDESGYISKSNEYRILVTLPYLMSEARHILKLVNQAHDVLSENVQFKIKTHPAMSMSRIEKELGSELLGQFAFTNEIFYDCLEKSDLLISNASSTCLEAVAKSIPVIIVANRFGLNYNPIPETIVADIYKICFDANDVIEAIQFYRTRNHEKIKEHEKVGKKIREEYFEPVTQEGVRRFLELPNSSQ